MLALSGQSETPVGSKKKGMYVAYAEGKREEAIKKVAKMRENGNIVELAFTAQTEDEAKQYRLSKNISEFIYIK